MLGDLASEIATQGGPRGKLPLFAKGMSRHQVHKMHPIVEFDDRGEVTCRWDYIRTTRHKDKFDRFRNDKLSKYLRSLEEEHARYRTIKEKTKPKDLREDFKDFYRRIKTEHIKPMQARLARQEARRAEELDEKRRFAA